jgi:hypothetical protein
MGVIRNFSSISNNNNNNNNSFENELIEDIIDK